MNEVIKLHERGKFFFYYFNKALKVFESTLLEACVEADQKKKLDPKVKLFKFGSEEPLNFKEIIKEVLLAEKEE